MTSPSNIKLRKFVKLAIFCYFSSLRVIKNSSRFFTCSYIDKDAAKNSLEISVTREFFASFYSNSEYMIFLLLFRFLCKADYI